jgi:hypothetical protein
MGFTGSIFNEPRKSKELSIHSKSGYVKSKKKESPSPLINKFNKVKLATFC